MWRRRPDVLWRRSVEAVILGAASGGDPVTLTGTGAAVWDLLEEPTTLADLVAVLAAEYGADPAVVEHDVAALLADLQALGVVA